MKRKHLINILIIFLISSLICYCFLDKGYFKETDDWNFLYPNLYSLNSLVFDKYPLTYVTRYLMHNTNYGTRIFYSPLSQYLVVYNNYFFRMGILNSLKFIYYLSLLSSGLIMYLISYKFYKKSDACLVTSIIYITFPYRIVDMMYRNSLAESITFIFIPLVFYSFYRIITKRNYKYFIYFAVSFSLLILTHNVISFYMGIILLITAIIKYKETFKLIKSMESMMYTLISGCIIVGLTSIYLYPMIIQDFSLYRVFDATIMNTSLHDVIGSISGVIPTLFRAVSSNLSYVLFYVLFIVIYKYKKNMLLLYTFVVAILLGDYLVLMHAIVIYLVLYNFDQKLETPENKFESLASISNFFIVLCILLMASTNVWKIMPNILYNIQFVTRLYTFICFFLSISVGIYVYYSRNIKTKTTIIIISLMTFFLLTPITKEIVVDNSVTIDETSKNVWYQGGWQHEYLPIYFLDETYQSDSSLFNEMKQNIINANENIEYNPIILTGLGDITRYQNDLPEVYIEVETDESAIVQMPLIYFKGYKIVDNNTHEEISYYEKDGLVTFSIDKNSDLTITFDPIGKIRYVFFSAIAITIVMLLMIYIKVVIKKKNLHKI